MGSVKVPGSHLPEAAFVAFHCVAWGRLPSSLCNPRTRSSRPVVLYVSVLSYVPMTVEKLVGLDYDVHTIIMMPYLWD